ncbi:transaldolase family protein [Roseisolibacter sp. H3M3-2]|uniref:transaldolase family protein n=1 Tax=Roseisolibacter sp. H3M3-2 TaxID=3031323 RepID=UPI0023DC6449|nr:transaldolase family protein [Roseisolibacter sp. H3M3-2]MDF1501526.1 transaldolase family protein [Roseisolibacter sp. H3M3-2]
MKLLLASASVPEIAWAVEHGLADGLVPSPSQLVEQRPGDPRELLEELARSVALPIYASVSSIDPLDMHRDGRELARIADNVVVQLPLVDDAVVAIRRLSVEGVRVAATLVFSAAQALLAAKAGASVVTVPVDQLDALGQDSTVVVRQIRSVFDRGHVECDLVAAGPRAASGFTACAESGADAAVVDLATMRAMLVHPLTDRGIDAFLRELTTRAKPRITPI